MAAGRKAAMALLGALGGAVIGGLAGLGGGLAWSELASVSGDEGYSGFVVAYWILAGIVLGLIAGAIFGARRG